ncbi:beta-phosphoglucomutase family hydrolase [Pseudoclavibacter sp. RFBA6]|uniref:HAD family hydrolase n=1 Tax=Pseudoclavibacter sp. RFBA6 TaxID=2080573 RepID=UPI0028006DD4|nr:beta-phosphoglucomutase family hydrolase [Pseudoclavibacter sp. RFBA6]
MTQLTSSQAILFDLDGVITPTAEVHMRAWARLFTDYLTLKGVGPAYTDDDYLRYIDGKPRYDGVRSFLASRGITLEDGTPEDSPELETVCGLGNRKNDTFNSELAETGVKAYPGSVEFLNAAVDHGLRVAVVSSSRNAVPVLTAAGLLDRFETVVDGLVAAQHGIAGKPAPDTYLYAAQLLGLTAAQCVVVEDAHSGVQAGRDGDFGLVIGVSREASHEELMSSGADTVVDDLAELVPVFTNSDSTAVVSDSTAVVSDSTAVVSDSKAVVSDSKEGNA